MTVIGILLRKIEAETKKIEKPVEQLNVVNTPKIKKVEEADERAIGIKGVISIHFEFETKYDPEIGSIKIEGELLYKAENPKEILDMWKKSKKLSEDMAIDVLNMIFRRCILLAMNTAAEFQLPPPIKLPAFAHPAEKEEEKKKK